MPNSDDKRWNDAVDWLLNSRHTADPDIQGPFWAYVDGLITRDELDHFSASDVQEREAERATRATRPYEQASSGPALRDPKDWSAEEFTAVFGDRG